MNGITNDGNSWSGSRDLPYLTNDYTDIASLVYSVLGDEIHRLSSLKLSVSERQVPVRNKQRLISEWTVDRDISIQENRQGFGDNGKLLTPVLGKRITNSKRKGKKIKDKKQRTLESLRK
jgi:hypothetical protein